MRYSKKENERFLLIQINNIKPVTTDINPVITATKSDGATEVVAHSDLQVTGMDLTQPGTLTVTVTYEGKSVTFAITVTEPPYSIVSKTITNLDFATVQATQAKLISKPVTVNDFTGNPKSFEIVVQRGERLDIIPVSIYWKLSSDFSNGLSMGSVVESSIQDFYNTDLMNRPIWAAGNYENDQFFIGTFATGSQATISVRGADWQYFFDNSQAQGTDLDSSKNRTFTISDGMATATIHLTYKFATIDALINNINNRLLNSGVQAVAEKVGTSQFKITATAEKDIEVTGLNKSDFFE